jgi:iron(III) transport system ATP-binding protein
MATVTIRNLTKKYGDQTVLKDLNLTLEDGEFATLLGPSGCGKTTTLRLIAGFEQPTSGTIRIGDTLVSDGHTLLPPEKRDIGMVFQSYAVWPHMNVFKNVAYPLKLRKLSKEMIREKTEHMLEIVHMRDLADRMPDELSGGQQQRVALARALVAEPKVLLLDEPLSNLDAKLRDSMRREIKDLQKRLGISIIYVTHDQNEALTMSNRVIVMNEGVIQQTGTPMEIFQKPANDFVDQFVGQVIRNQLADIASFTKISAR